MLANEQPTLTFADEFLLSKHHINIVGANNHSPNNMATDLFTNWYKQQAQELISNLTEKLAQKHKLKYNQIKISNAKTRWGSCSAQGNLSFSWRLIMAPPEAIEYVIIHELAHLEHLNHSTAFWQKVASMLPDYKKHRTWFKANGGTLSL